MSAIDLSAKPRPHHYHFAHRVLPTLFYEAPFRVLQAALKEPFRLRMYWRMAHAMLADAGSPADELDAEGLALAHQVSVDGWSGALVQLPPAARPAEAIAVLLMLRGAGEPPPQQQALYVTLELGVATETGAACAFLCAWEQRDGRPVHVNHGVVDLDTDLGKAVKRILPA